MTGHQNLRQFISALRKENEIIDVFCEVDPHLELAEIHRRVSAAEGPALFFHRVKNHRYPVVTNLFGSKRRIEIAFNNQPEKIIENAVKLIQRDFPPSLKTLWENKNTLKSVLTLGTKKRKNAPVAEVITEANLQSLPLIKSWPEDGGSFITLPLVYTENLKGQGNLGIYRMQRYNESEAGLHFQIGKGGGFHYDEAERANIDLPVQVFLGGPPALMISAIAPLPENVPELIFASLLAGKKLDYIEFERRKVISECEFALIGIAKPHKRRLEGPFGDHFGYYSLKHPFPVFTCQKILRRKDAIYPATVVGKPYQEDFYIGQYLQELLSPLFPLVMPGVKSLWSYGETGFHSLAAAYVHERYYRECMTSAFRILGEGQLALTKFLLLTNQPVNPRNIKEVLPCILERFKPESDLFIFSNLSLDTLDYTGPKLNQGSRGVMLGIGDPIRKLSKEFLGPLPSFIKKVKAFCPGCLVIEADPSINDYSPILNHPAFEKWPLLILVDHLEKSLRSEASFLWTVFTRFEPASDIYAKSTKTVRHHLCYSGPILIDAKMKPHYPKEVLVDEETESLVKKRWKTYFSSFVKSGESRSAHVC